MGLAASRQWNEMNEVNKALEEAQADTQAKQKETRVHRVAQLPR